MDLTPSDMPLGGNKCNYIQPEKEALVRIEVRRDKESMFVLESLQVKGDISFFK